MSDTFTLRFGDSWCRTKIVDLRGGVQLNLTSFQMDPALRFDAAMPRTELELTVSRGSSMRVQTPDARTLARAGNELRLARSARATPLSASTGGSLRTECVSVALPVAELRALAGWAELPHAFASIALAEDPFASTSETMTPALDRLLDELMGTTPRAAAKLWYQGKTLELVASIADELVEADRARRAPLGARDLEGLERVRQRLSERLDVTPTIESLARLAGVSVTRLKGQFRVRFGTSVFAYLRGLRMIEARSLLRERGLSVTEVASRVGYANPSKFAAAFRRELGASPSAIRA